MPFFPPTDICIAYIILLLLRWCANHFQVYKTVHLKWCACGAESGEGSAAIYRVYFRIHVTIYIITFYKSFVMENSIFKAQTIVSFLDKLIFITVVGYIHAFDGETRQPDLFPRYFSCSEFCSVKFGSIRCSWSGQLNISIWLIDLYERTQISKQSLFSAMH